MKDYIKERPLTIFITEVEDQILEAMATPLALEAITKALMDHPRNEGLEEQPDDRDEAQYSVADFIERLQVGRAVHADEAIALHCNACGNNFLEDEGPLKDGDLVTCAECGAQLRYSPPS